MRIVLILVEHTPSSRFHQPFLAPGGGKPQYNLGMGVEWKLLYRPEGAMSLYTLSFSQFSKPPL